MIVLVFPLMIMTSINGQYAVIDTVCSDPKRARVLAKATVMLPGDDIDHLGDDLARISKIIGMTTWSVGSEQKGRRTSLTLGLQSPKVSVNISIDWKPGQRAASLSVERTCINDELEPWLGYWTGFKRELTRLGYHLH